VSGVVTADESAEGGNDLGVIVEVKGHCSQMSLEDTGALFTML